MGRRVSETIAYRLRNRHKDEENRFSNGYIELHVYHGLSQHFADLARARERSIEPYRELFEKYCRTLDLNAVDPRERSFALRCLSTARSSFALRLRITGKVDAAIEQIKLALADINGIEAHQMRCGLYNSLGYYFSDHARLQDSEQARNEDLKQAFKCHAQSLNYVKNNPTLDVAYTLGLIARVLEKNPATASQSRVLHEMIQDMTPSFSRLEERAKHMYAEDLIEELRSETEIGPNPSLEETAKAVAACAVLRRYKKARELAKKGSRLAQDTGEFRWWQEFAEYLGEE